MNKYSLTMIAGLALLCCAGCISKRPTKEAHLKQYLYSMRQAIDQYTQDKNAAPQDLEDLVRAGYLRSIPTDPITNSSKTWKVVQEDMMESVKQTAPGITDVHSGSDQISTEGTPYSSW